MGKSSLVGPSWVDLEDEFDKLSMPCPFDELIEKTVIESVLATLPPSIKYITSSALLDVSSFAKVLIVDVEVKAYVKVLERVRHLNADKELLTLFSGKDGLIRDVLVEQVLFNFYAHYRKGGYHQIHLSEECYLAEIAQRIEILCT